VRLVQGRRQAQAAPAQRRRDSGVGGGARGRAQALQLGRLLVQADQRPRRDCADLGQ